MKANHFKARYQVGDGYAGGARPQHFAIYESDFDESDDLDEVFESAMQSHFEQNIFPEGYGSSLEDFKEWAREVLEARKV